MLADAEAGYGFPLTDGRFIGAPTSVFGFSGGTWEHGMGYRLTLERGEGVTLGVKLELASREHASDDTGTERAIMLSGEASW